MWVRLTVGRRSNGCGPEAAQAVREQKTNAVANLRCGIDTNSYHGIHAAAAAAIQAPAYIRITSGNGKHQAPRLFGCFLGDLITLLSVTSIR